MPDFDTYQSPFTWRYGSDTMRQIWSERNKRLLWRQMWVALAQVEAEFGLVSANQLADLQSHAADVDLERAMEIERQVHHDLVAELKTYAEQAPAGGAILHLGATSMDIEDNAEALRIRQSIRLIQDRLGEFLRLLADEIEQQADTVVMAFTHLQPAEPTTLGYRLAFSAQDLLEDWQRLQRLSGEIRGKGFKGAVGTGAAFVDLVGAEHYTAFEQQLSDRLDLPFFAITHQTYPRKQDYEVLSALAGIAASVYKLAFDIRLLQSPPIGEIAEPFGAQQIGSSAMPFKRNPILAEKIDSLARSLAQMPRVAWDNAAHSLLERTLDDSANRRSLLPEAFLTTDEMLLTAQKIAAGLRVDAEKIKRNLRVYGPFAATERVLTTLVKAGADRQETHAALRVHALAAWQALQTGQENPLEELILNDPGFRQICSEQQLREALRIDHHVGIAPEKARWMAQTIRQTLSA
ncbi:MAG TPA: adenylosuccinate lyase [Anaerolineaceae bacterium]|nr:adenylosuccinate lyase [Anaerolineaceae bacterium]